MTKSIDKTSATIALLLFVPAFSVGVIMSLFIADTFTRRNTGNYWTTQR